MRVQETDLASDLTAPVFDQGAGGGGDFGDGSASLAEQLTGDTPPVVMQNFTPAVESGSAVADAPASTPSTAPASTTTVDGSPGFFTKLTSALGSAQGKLPMGGLRSAPLQLAAKLGADTETASTIAVWLWPVVVVVAGISVTVYLLRRRIFSHHVTA